MTDRHGSPNPSGDRSPFVLAATKLRVVSAEMTDSGRLMRGRTLHAEGAVGDMSIAPGLVTASVQGTDPVPYTVRWHVAPLSATVEQQRRGLLPQHARRSTMLVPAAADLSPSCTCVDAASMVGSGACKHAVAVLQSLADAVEHDAEHLATWRGVDLEALGAVDPADPALDHRSHDDDPDTSHRRAARRPDSSRIEPRHGAGSAPVDPLADLLSFPAGARLPAGRFVIAPLDAPAPDADDTYGTVLADALEWLRHVSPW